MVKQNSDDSEGEGQLIDFGGKDEERDERQSVELSKNLYDMPTERVTGDQLGQEGEGFRYDFNLREMTWSQNIQGVVVVVSVWTEDGRMVGSIGIQEHDWKEKSCSEICHCEPSVLKEDAQFVITLLSDVRLNNVVVCVGPSHDIEGGGGWFQTYNVNDYKTLQCVKNNNTYSINIAQSRYNKQADPIELNLECEILRLPQLQCGKCLEVLYCVPGVTTTFTCTHCNSYNNTTDSCSVLQSGFGLFFCGLALFIATSAFFVVGLMFGLGVLVYGWILLGALLMGRGCFYCYASSCVVQAISEESPLRGDQDMDMKV